MRFLCRYRLCAMNSTDSQSTLAEPEWIENSSSCLNQNQLVTGSNYEEVIITKKFIEPPKDDDDLQDVKKHLSQPFNAFDNRLYDWKSSCSARQDQELAEYKKRFARICWQKLQAHTSDVNCVEFASNQLLVSCSNDKTVRVWRADSKEAFAECQAQDASSSSQLVPSPLLGHGYGVNAVRVSPFGTILASASTDGRIILWNTQDGRESAVLSQPSESAVRCLNFSPSSALLATGGDDECVCLWDLSSRALLRCLRGPEAMISCVSFSPDSQLIVAGSSGGELWVWQAQGVRLGARTAVVQAAHDLGVLALEFAPEIGCCPTLTSGNGNGDQMIRRQFLLASCGNDDLIRLWTVSTPGPNGRSEVVRCRDLRGHTSNVNCCRFNSDGQLLASASGDKSVIIWSVDTGQLLVRLEAHSRYVTSVAFSPDGRLLASGSNDQSVIVWGLAGQSFDGTSGGILKEEEMSYICDYNQNAGTRCPIDSGGGTAIEIAAANQMSLSIIDWSVDQVIEWLKSIQLEEFENDFRRQQIDGTELIHLTHDVMQNRLRIESMGKRNKLLRAVQTLRNPYWRRVPPSGDWQQQQSLPDELYCPITHMPMIFPVVAHDGYSYEREAIEEWFQNGNHSSPMTNEPLVSLDLIPNHSLKMLIGKFITP